MFDTTDERLLDVDDCRFLGMPRGHGHGRHGTLQTVMYLDGGNITLLFYISYFGMGDNKGLF